MGQRNGGQGRIGGDHHNDRPGFFWYQTFERHEAANGLAQHVEPRAFAVIGLHQNAHGIGLIPNRHTARGGAGACLELISNHAGATAHRTFGDGARCGTVQRFDSMFGLHEHRVDVVQNAIISFGDHRHGPGDAVAEMVGIAVNHPACRTRVAGPNAVGVGDQNRAQKIAAVLDPMRPGHLAIAVQRGLASADGFGVAGIHPRDDRRDSGAHMAGRVLQGAKPHADPGHIGDGIQRAGRAGKRQAKITGAGHGVSFRSETRTGSRLG